MNNLTLQSVRTLFPNATQRHYQKGQIICYSGDKPNNVFFMVSGHVRYYDIDENGNEKILHLLGPNNIFPMLFAYQITEQVNGFYSTIEATDVIAIPLAEFVEVSSTNIEFSNTLNRWFLTELNQLAYRISSLEKTDARLKVLNAIKYLAIDYGQQKGTWQSLNFAITQQFLADLTGLTRETVSSTMQELEKDNLVRSRKKRGLEVKRAEIEKIS